MSARRKILYVLVVGAAIAATFTITTTPAFAAYTTYVSVQTPSGSTGTKVLDIRDYSLADRGQAQLWDLRNSGELRNQQWTITLLYTNGSGHGVYQLKNALSLKCLDKSLDVPDADGNAVYQYGCNANASNQQWEQMGSSGWVQLRNVSDGRCLDVAGPSYSNGAILHIWNCYSTWSQRWNNDL
jgi:hypothetical protein